MLDVYTQACDLGTRKKTASTMTESTVFPQTQEDKLNSDLNATFKKLKKGYGAYELQKKLEWLEVGLDFKDDQLATLKKYPPRSQGPSDLNPK